MASKITTLLETETCGRCGGSGSYSYCSMYGRACFRCNGRGWTLTKRGAAASRHLAALRSKPAGELVVGDVFLHEGFSCGSLSVSSKWATVVSIEPDVEAGRSFDHDTQTWTEHRGIKITHSLGAWVLDPETSVRIRQTAEQARATLEAALAYQATLGRSGAPLGDPRGARQ